MLIQKQHSKLQINFTKNLEPAGSKTKLGEVKVAILDFSEETGRVLFIHFVLI